ncbi:MAG: stage III sporulation protein AB [Desulfitobacteriaceae bacterium]|nr:stage III sporulation protein AB [Desulfitobacteriaceae bacterium]MDD4401060.1 stage III sporulation protein AB [Desulfitobacteriaceae bacterium]
MIILGCIGLIGGCGITGLWQAGRIRRRPRELREFLTLLVLLDTEINWGLTPLPEAFSNLQERSSFPWQNFLSELKNKVQAGESAGQAWASTILNQQKKFCLKPEDWQVIGDVGKGLGRSDKAQQHKQLELVQKQLVNIREQAVVWAEKQAKMWSYLGFIVGIAGVIFLI